MNEILLTKPTKKLENEAKKLGFSSVHFIDGEDIVLVKTEDKNELRRKISSLSSKGRKIVVLGSNDEINRIAVEDKRVTMLLSPESNMKKDYMKSRNSGLNHVLCKLAKSNDVVIGIDYSKIKSSKGLERAELLGKVMQNVRLCRKFNTKLVLASFGKKPVSPYALKSLAAALGMSTKQIKESLENAEKAFA